MTLQELASYRLEISARIVAAPGKKQSQLQKVQPPTQRMSGTGKPEIAMSGPGRLLSSVAHDLGVILKEYPFFNYVGKAAYLAPGSLHLETLTAERMRTHLETFVVPVKVDAGGRSHPHSISAAQARSFLGSERFLHQLRAVDQCCSTRFPSFNSAGKLILQKEGYDAELRTLTAAAPVIDEKLSISAARVFLNDLLRDFPFADEGRSKSAAMAAMLTLFGQHILPPGAVIPAFLYEANRPGAGKGLLANSAIIPALGHPITGVKPRDENEMRKHLFAVAREDLPVFFMDNVDRQIASPSLESFITTSTVTGRVLGASRTLTARKSTVVMITANGGKLSPDMSRRTITCALHLVSAPETRSITNPLDENALLQLRPQILSALYALIRNWDRRGRPRPSRANTNFVPWSETIGGILEHNGYALPY